MASGTRGKLKENVEGIHRNCEWIKEHCKKSVILLDGKYDTLQTAFESLAEIAVNLDEFALKLYSQL